MLATTDSENPINNSPVPTTEQGVEPLRVRLPQEMQTFFCESGYLPTTSQEFRGNARLRVRSKAVLSVTSVLPVLRESKLAKFVPGEILIKDLSRSGIGFLYHRELYPTQRIKVHFQGRVIESTIVRCRRVGELCYEIGGRVSETKTVITE